MQVPYTPYATTQTAAPASPEVSIQTTGAAFGENIGKATEGLGKTIEGAGNELFARAIAMQNLANQTEAQETDAKYMIAAGKLHADYSALQGKDAVDAYPKYAENLQSLRASMRDGMSNDMSRKMFDSSSLSTMGRTIFNGAGHAATQNKLWAIGTAKAQIDLDAKTVEDNPSDEVLFKDKLNRVRENAESLSALQGYEAGGAQEKDLALKASSKLWAQRITGLARTAPFDAAKMLDEHKTELSQDDYLKVDNTVRSQGRAVGSVNIANDVYSAGRGDDSKPSKPLAEMEAEARAKAKAFDPHDPLLAQHAVAALHGIYNQDKYANRQADLENQQTVDAAIMSGVKTEQELRADPKVAAAIDALPKDKRLGIPGAINRYNAARDAVANNAAFNTLNGMRLNDPEEFLNQDVTKVPGLSQHNMTYFMNQQAKLKGNPDADPRVSKALGMIKGSMAAQLEALGIYRRTDANKEDYDHFTGALSSALDVWTETHGKPPDYKQVTTEIAPQLLQQRSEPAWFGLTTAKKPFFTQEVPEEWAKDLKADVVAKGGLEPTDEQVYRAYVRTKFMKLYAKPKVQDKATPGKPAAPDNFE